jgi:IS5 family transposase
MIKYKPANQLSIEEFRTPFELKLDKDNRWVKLASIIPWDELAGIFYQSMSTGMGAPSIDARIVIGSMVIKHKLKLDDREVVETIRENIYLQYFLGLSAYTAEPLFDRSLFTAFRYRLGQDKFDLMSQRIIAAALGIAGTAVADKEETKPPGDRDDAPVDEGTAS